MSTQADLIQWLEKMGFDGEIPESFGHICNSSTSFIWNELIQNVKSKQEVEILKTNIIVHRLKSKPLNKQDEFSYPIKEIDIYSKKQILENKLRNMQLVMNEKRNKVNNLSKNNKMKYITMERLKSKVRENLEREHLLDFKGKMLEKNIKKAEDTLTYAKNLTPVELEENPDTKNITETLHKCAEKLEKLLCQKPFAPNDANSSRTPFRLFSASHKTISSQITFEKILCMSERKHSRHKEHMNSVTKDIYNRENIGNNKVSKCLFTTVNEKCITTETNANEIKQNVKCDKRISLGILSDSFVNKSRNFMDNVNTSDLFSSPLCPLQETSTYKKQRKLNCEQYLYSKVGYDSKFQETYDNKTFDLKTTLHNLCNDDFVTGQLRNLLYKHNRQIILHTLKNLNNHLMLDITKNIISESEENVINRGINKYDISKLQFLHVRNELHTLKHKFALKDLSGKISKQKENIFIALSKTGFSQEKIDNISKLFNRQLENVKLDATLSAIKKEINAIKKMEDDNNLQIVLQKVLHVKDTIVVTVGRIQQHIYHIHEILQSTIRMQEATLACVHKLGSFVEDMAWCTPLTENICSTEIKLFENFPIEYNRQCVHIDPKLYYRDICSDNVPLDVELDSVHLEILTSILESPFNPPEAILLNILKCKMKLDALKSLPNSSLDIKYNKYSLEQLQLQESYVQFALDKFSSIIYSTTSTRTLSTGDFTKEVMEIWLDMPFKDFISPQRTLEGRDYKFYEKKYDSFYNYL